MRFRPLAAVAALALGAALAAGPAPASAQDWPSRPITMVVPFAAGTTSDVIGRALVEHLGRSLGQTVVIDNRSGAGGNIGAASVAKAPADGYTILLATTGQAATNKLMYKDITYDPQKDFAPVVLIGRVPVVVTARPDLKAGTLAELIALAKAEPGKLTAGFPGNGTLGHITGLLLMAKGDIKLGQAQYRGSVPIMTDLLGGHIDVGMDSMAAYVPNIREGKLKALAIASPQRWSGLPNVPTAAESGLPGFEAAVWYALLAPAGTPPAVIAKLNAATNSFLQTDQARQMFDRLGVIAAGGTPQDLAAYQQAEIAKWGPIIKAANISF
ncbi:tripartite tricarboxylate transporter substrate binding protein [Rhodoplanes sp. TEM]|uniref:Tripartite tricarboxylate transporter substrate binding protein n=1 Tax=Rhodoplanes tepidamans TaxID=200616 RepID=A0ABT5JE90_RHOTP|nr:MULTISPECIES: tripartite tricarboxylate transporter substrate binding protein [Rhodoplanes]MDC7787400.1 tripartite tricarboxylate transporter substrate binding protein [Rhodoplanes tepidamans]MDC7985519.1 tripartite tricarboxylate transporter substrate binding protein [Rhodoplanes sp. TEM]MDQ0358114.1 tripartite-type tricarboxylate transporter receptor subunit TctC [Rhodoplanes tepidamans]